MMRSVQRLKESVRPRRDTVARRALECLLDQNTEALGLASDQREPLLPQVRMRLMDDVTRALIATRRK